MKLLIISAVIALIYTSVMASDFCSGSNEVFQECGSACEKTCAELGANQTCNEKCVPGCFCADGFVRLNHSGQCVPSSECPKVRVRRAPEPLPPLIIPVPIPIPIPVPPIVRPRGPLWWLRPPPPPLFG